MYYKFLICNYQQEKSERLATNTKPMGRNEVYEELGECINSTFNMEQNISYATVAHSGQ